MFMCIVSSDACSFPYRWMDTVMVGADLMWREMEEDLLWFYSITLVRINTVAGKHCTRRSLPRVAPYIASLHMVHKQKEADLLFICLGMYKLNEVKKRKGLGPAHRFSPWIIERRWVLWFSRERLCFFMVRDTQCLLSALRFLIFTVPLFIFGLFCSAHQHLVINYTTYSGSLCIKQFLLQRRTQTGRAGWSMSTSEFLWHCNVFFTCQSAVSLLKNQIKCLDGFFSVELLMIL